MELSLLLVHSGDTISHNPVLLIAYLHLFPRLQFSYKIIFSCYIQFKTIQGNRQPLAKVRLGWHHPGLLACNNITWNFQFVNDLLIVNSKTHMHCFLNTFLYHFCTGLLCLDHFLFNYYRDICLFTFSSWHLLQDYLWKYSLIQPVPYSFEHSLKVFWYFFFFIYLKFFC